MTGHLKRFRVEPSGRVIVEWYDPATLRMSASEGYFPSREAAEATIGPESAPLTFELAALALKEATSGTLQDLPPDA